MSDKVLLVTAPDDTSIDAIRILLVNLTQDQTQIISDTIKEFTSIPNLVLYVWNDDHEYSWLFDKKQKSQIIIFNAESANDLVVGYLAAHHKSHYFGTLKTLAIVNKNAIYNVNDCVNLLNNLIIRYE